MAASVPKSNAAEDIKSKKMKCRRQKINPLDVTESLGYQTHRRGIRKPWSKEDDDVLRNAVHQSLLELGYPEGIDSIRTIRESQEVCKQIPWEKVVLYFDTKVRKPKDVRKRWTSSLDPNLKKGRWTPEEDRLLLESYERHGPQWLKVSQELAGRTEDQCAKRYIEVLDPSTKDRLREWTMEEDLALISKVKMYGTKWRQISSEMESRPSLTCRNRWRKIITMVIRGKASEIITQAVESGSEMLSKKGALQDTLRTHSEEQVLDGEDGESGNTNALEHGGPPPRMDAGAHETTGDHPEQNGISSSHPDRIIETGVPTLLAVHGRPKEPHSAVEMEGSPGYTSESTLFSHQTVRIQSALSPQDCALRSNSDNTAKRDAQTPNMQVGGSVNYMEDETNLAFGVPVAHTPVQRPAATPHTQNERIMRSDTINSSIATPEDPTAADRTVPQPGQPSRQAHPGLSGLPGRPAQVLQHAQPRIPDSSFTEWKYSLKGPDGVTIGGDILEVSMVEKLVNYSKQNGISISIHQHVHHHYVNTVVPQAQLGDDKRFDASFNSTFGLASRQPGAFDLDVDLGARTSHYDGLMLDALPQAPLGNLYMQNYNMSPQPPFSRPPTTSSAGSGKADLSELSPQRKAHFTALPPHVRLQLGSSDAGKDSSQRPRKQRRKRPRDPAHSSASSATNTPHSAVASPGARDPAPSAAPEEEEDFWESLRKLASVPPRSAERPAPQSNSWSAGEPYRGLPYNPS
ncbi:AaceriAFR297Wp [[Ashbya] aceris (nom. inval.)]|nr:AaceriAFR297Wp [[Ashbya] aceris (nom. inval.)]